jgi:opacity protein-like surface antigen
MAALCVISVSAASFADAGSPSNRTGRWQATFGGTYLDSTTIKADGGAKAEINGDLGMGFGIGYNFNENLALDFELGWNSVSYDATRVEDGTGNRDNYSSWLDTSSTRFNLTYNFLAKRLTPFVAANLGWTWVDTNIPSGPPSSNCWWDWYGNLVCSGYQPTYNKTEFSYGASLGLRYDVNDSMFLRGLVGDQWIDYSNASGTPDFVNYRFDVGFNF